MTILKQLVRAFALDKIDPSWARFPYWQSSQFAELLTELNTCYNQQICYPPRHLIFRPFFQPLTALKVVILAQDPYYSPGRADGLAFSTSAPNCPASLANILQVLAADLQIRPPVNCFTLDKWSSAGVFLLNCSLTVVHNQPLAHEALWWKFNQALLNFLSAQLPNLLWLVFGRCAWTRVRAIACQPANVFITSHPSPRSAQLGFLRSRPFSWVNQRLIAQGQSAIDWQL